MLFSAILLKLWSGAWFRIRDESGTEATMSKAYFNPDDLFPSQQYGFSQVIAASGKTTVYLSGQVAWNAQQKIVHPLDLGAQTRRALENLENCDKASGGTPADVVSFRLYIVGVNIFDTV